MPTRAWWVPAALCFFLSVSTASAQPVGGSQDPVNGAKLFESKGCGKCHAINGLGGKIGPDLAKIARPHSFADLAAGIWNHLPRMSERMKALGITREKVDGKEAGDLVAFLFTLNYFDRPGNAAAGKRLFTDKGCVSCHQVGGAGGNVGPALDALKAMVSPIYVASAMWNHGPQMAEQMKARGIARPTFTADELRDLIAFLAPATAGPDKPVYVLPGRAEVGRTLFAEKKCAQCHAVNEAGPNVGPTFGARGARRNPMELAAAMWNKAPLMQAALKPEMGGLPQLTPTDMSDLVAYLYSVGYFGQAGRPTQGWKVMLEKGCFGCHSVYGERGKPASDLTRAKGLNTPAGVLAGLWNHTIVTVPAPGGGKAAWPSFKPQEMADLVALLQGMQRAQ